MSPETWRRTATYLLKRQLENGVWGYVSDSRPMLSMTLAGVAGLATAHRHLPNDDQAVVSKAALDKPHELIAKNHPRSRVRFLFCTYQSLERADHLTSMFEARALSISTHRPKRVIECGGIPLTAVPLFRTWTGVSWAPKD